MKKILLAGALAATTMLGATTASAGIIQLGFILDRSGSVPEPDWGVITTGLADAMDNIPLPGDDTYEVSVVTFASSATIAIANRALTTVAEVDALKADILALDTAADDTSGLTDYQAAFTAMQDALNNTTGVSFSYVNFATDGVPTDSSGPGSDNADGIAARNALIADVNSNNIGSSGPKINISIEGIDISASAASNLQDNYCYPGPCDTSVPYNFPTQGFYIGVDTAAQYAAAIDNKVLVVTGQAPVPAPAPIALLGIGLVGGLLARRRKRAAA